MEEVKEFLEIEEFENGLSEGTIKKYKNDLKIFFKFLELKHNIKRLDSLDHKNIQKLINRFISYLKNEGYKPRSINGKIITINKFMKFKEYDCKGKLIKLQKSVYIENIVSESDYKRLIEKCKSNKRDRAILMTLANTGLRVSELLSLKISDVNKSKLIVYGKGGKTREVILIPQLKEVLNNYINCERLNTDDKALFTGERGALKRAAINKIILKYSKVAYVNKSKAHPHSFRHFYAKRLLAKGVSIDMVQSLLGHEDINTTAIYTKGTKKEIVDVLRKAYIN